MALPNSSPLLNDLEADFFDADFEDEFIPYNYNDNDNLFGEDDFDDDFGLNHQAAAPDNPPSPIFDSPFFDALPRDRRREQERPPSASSSPNSQPPPSNQQARRSPTPAYDRPSPRDPSPALSDDSFFQPAPASPRMAPNVATRSSSVVDLTSSPVQSHRPIPILYPDESSIRRAERYAANNADHHRVVRSANKRKRENEEAGEGASKADVSNISLVDLSAIENDEQYEEFKAKEAAKKEKEQAEAVKAQNIAESIKPVRLAEFQCIICMDSPTDLTVTHCGHLFCSECLHSALYAGDKKCCPVCRNVINTRPGPGGKAPKNGVYALEMKLMTRNKKGKQAVR